MRQSQVNAISEIQQLNTLIPGSYNKCSLFQKKYKVVVPSLTPGSYNGGFFVVMPPQVVVPSLTPGSYNYWES